MVAWPSDLPQEFEWENYATDLVGDNLIESQADAGPPLTRARSTAVAREMSGTMVLDADGVEALAAFVADDLLDGSLVFTFPAQSHGSGDLTVKFKKGGLPRITGVLTEDHYRVGFTLWVMP